MAYVQIHCYGCPATVAVADSRMAADLEVAGWAVSRGETYCRRCAAARGLGDEARVPLPPLVSAARPAAHEGRVARSWRLLGVAARVLGRYPGLMTFPLVAIVANLLIGGVAYGVAASASGGVVSAGQVGHMGHALTIAALVAGYPAACTTIFCGVALAVMLGAQLDGEPVTVADAWRGAWARLPLIAAWALVSCTLGALLRTIERSVPRFVIAIIDISWGLLTLFAVPVLAYERLGPFATLNRSSALMRARWGEQISGTVGIGIATGLLSVPCGLTLLIGFFVPGAAGVACVVLGGGGLLAVAAGSAALEQVFRVCVYRYAAGHDSAGALPFADDDLERPFKRPGRGRRQL